MESVEGKTAVVTGGGSGMGRSVAIRLARAGCNVVVSDIVSSSADAVASEAQAHGVEALAVTTDVADSDANDALLDATIDAFGQVNIVFLNAGVTGSVGRSWTLSEADWDWTLGINLKGVINGMRSFVPHLVEHGDGHVVATASIAGHISSPYGGPYNVSKHGVAVLMETLHHELRADEADVGVTCLCPGFVNTNIITAARERPTGGTGRAVDAPGERWFDISERALSTGLDPDVVGDQVHDAILADQFWLFTDRAWDEAISQRVGAIVERRPPPMGLPTRPQ